METFWFFWLRFRRAYDSAYDSNVWFSLGHKRSYDSDSESVASENQTTFSVMDNFSFVPIHMVSFVAFEWLRDKMYCMLKQSLWIINAFGVWRISLRWTM